MENFIVSARKYRPASFDMVIGQDTVTNTLRSAIKNNHLAHAYLFCGPRGVGKTTCARIFAKTINCSNIDENGEACDKCESCLSFNSLRSFNIHELDAASNNKVEDIRSLNEQVRIPPQIGKYSIYIIDEVHMLSTSAFNAFLKTLEEPPTHAIFILATTEKHKIIPTILSRCQIFDFNRIRLADIVTRLMYVAKSEGIQAEEEALHIIGQKADGALRDALSIFDQIVSLTGKKISYGDVIGNLNVLDYEYYFRVVDAALMKDVSSVLLIFNEVLEKGFDGHNFISGLNSHLRDLLVCKDESTLRLLDATAAIKQKYLQQTARCPDDFIFRALEIGTACELSYRNSKNQRLHVELSLMRLCMLTGNRPEDEKKKPEPDRLARQEEPSPQPVRNQPVNDGNPIKVKLSEEVARKGSHDPVIEKPAKKISIKDLISGEVSEPRIAVAEKDSEQQAPITKEELTPEGFRSSWNEFVAQISGEGPRIVSMFKSMKTELSGSDLLRIHLNNTTQKETFVLNYKQKLISFLEERFNIPGFDVEIQIDLTEENEILYTDEQKYNYLLNKFPILKEMKNTFKLDIS